MTADIESLVLEHLWAICATQAEHGDEPAAIRVEISEMGPQLTGLTAAVYSGKSEMDGIKRRVERTERRFELSEPPH